MNPMIYRNPKNSLLTKNEKDIVEEALLSGIDLNKRWLSIKDVIEYCVDKEKEGYLGEFGLPFNRLLPYLKSLISMGSK